MKYGVWWIDADQKEQKEYFDTEDARMAKVKELMATNLPWKLIPEHRVAGSSMTTAKDVLKLVEEIGSRG